jgi:hypothetical protein
MYRGGGRLAWPTIVWLSLLVSAFMVVSLLVTATGTARFVTSMGYDAAVGYAVGVVFDLTKGSLLIIVLAFWARRSLPFAGRYPTRISESSLKSVSEGPRARPSQLATFGPLTTSGVLPVAMRRSRCRGSPQS